MAFSGKLEEMALPELLQFLAVNHKTGKLTLARCDGHGVVVLRKGKIIYAASNSIRETFGNILVCRGLVSEATLVEALDRQHRSPVEKRLGAVLIEMGRVRPEDLEGVMKQQTGVVLSELLRWTTGFFKFEAVKVPDRGEVEVDAKDFVMSEGLTTDRVLLELAGRGDQSPKAAARDSASLQEIMTEHPVPALRAEATLRLMRCATHVVSRGLLLAVRGSELNSIGHFGVRVAAGAWEPGTREFRIPLTELSVFSQVIREKRTYCGRLYSAPGNDRLVRHLGSRPASEVIVVPLIFHGRVVGAFYGDNAPENKPIGPIEGLERVMTEESRVMETEDFYPTHPRPAESCAEGALAELGG